MSDQSRFAAERIAVLCRERERVQQLLRPTEDGSVSGSSEAANGDELGEVTAERRAELTARIAEYDRLITRWSADLDESERGQVV